VPSTSRPSSIRLIKLDVFMFIPPIGLGLTLFIFFLFYPPLR
jgi:hypothetical protein